MDPPFPDGAQCDAFRQDTDPGVSLYWVLGEEWGMYTVNLVLSAREQAYGLAELQIQAYLVLLCFALLCFTGVVFCFFFFTN